MIPTTEPFSGKVKASSPALSVDNHRLFVAAVVLSVVPLWFGTYLPMVDVPGHAAVVAALQELSAGNQAFAAVFAVDWFTPYLMGYLLIYAAAFVMPVTIAIQILVSLSVAAVPLLTAILLRDAGADTRWKWLAIPASYSYAFYWGFLSFIAAVPLALLLLIWTVRFERRPILANALAIVALTLLLFFSHVIVMGFACLCALAYILGREHQNWSRFLRLCAPYTAPIPLIAAWVIPRIINEAGVAEAPIIYGDPFERIGLLLAQPAGSEYLSWQALLITALIVAVPPLTGATLARSPARWLPFAVVLFSFLAVPSYAAASGFLYERLGVFLVPFWLVMWNAPPSGRHRFDWVVMPLVAIWLFANAGRFAAFARETEHFDEVVAAMEPGKRVAAMIVDNGTPLFETPVYLHFGSYYQTLKAGIVDFNFADFRLVLRRKDMTQPRIDEYLSWYPERFDWAAHGGADYDYFLVKSGGGAPASLFKGRRESVKLVKQSGWWWVYENLDRHEQ